MWTRIKRVTLPITLFVLIMVSIVLSMLIWTNPARYDRAGTTTSANSTHTTVATRDIDDIYLPTQVIRTSGQGDQESLYNPKINLVTTLKNEVKKWRMTNFRKVSQGDKTAYEKLLGKKNMVQLNYADNIGRTIFNHSYGQSLLMSPSARFSRVMFSTTDSGDLYLLNDDTLTIYKITATKQDLRQIRSTLDSGKQHFAVKQDVSKDHVLTLYTDTVKIPRYSYLIGQQNANFFVNSLLNSGETSSVNVRKSGGHTSYSDGASKRLTVTDKTGSVLFEDYNASNKMGNDLGKNLKKSFSGLASTGLSLDSIRYFDNEKNGRVVTYRSFVEGFPIFNQTEFGAVQVRNDHANTEQINFTLTNLQVPLPTDAHSSVEVPATQTVLDQLTAAGVDQHKIKDVVLGYQWENNNDSKQVVDLQPAYYVYLNGKWQLADDIINGTTAGK